ncbi:tetratricopeptide repeat-containing sensor histidine kinase, partial [Bacteroides heparinolyticus]
ICLLCVLIIAGFVLKGQNLDTLLSLPPSKQQVDSALRITIYKKDLKSFTEKALENARKLKYSEGIMHALDQLGVMERNSSNYQASLIYHKECLSLSQRNQSDYWILRSNQNLGVLYRRLEVYPTALQYLLQALPLAEKMKNVKETASALNNIGNVYLALQRYDEAMNYFQKALFMDIKRNNYQGLSICHGCIGRVFEARNQLDSAQAHYEKNLFYSEGWNDKNGIAIAYNSMGNLARKCNRWNEALEYYQKALKMNLEIADRNYIAPSYCNVADVYKNNNNYALAEEFYKEALVIAEASGIKRNVARAYKGLSDVYEREGRFSDALIAERNFKLYEDSILNETSLRQIENIRTAYEVNEKELKIISLKKEKKLYVMVGLAILAALMAFVLLLYFRHKSMKIKKNLAEQRIIRLEQEKQLVATRALLDGETAERTRISRDLHDGLGGMLSAVKLNLFDMRKAGVSETDHVARINHVLKMLDNSILELRRISHNMMPETLSRYGLKIAITDLCHSFSNVKFHFFGTDGRLDAKLEIMVYRTIFELVNNALKHAEAKEINVQLVQEESRISVTVQDNGKGFDAKEETSGIGLKNIRNRIVSFNGIMNICSRENEGTEINVEIKI